MKLDAHVHTVASGMTTIWPLNLLMRESYNTPEGVYRLAKARGMDLVAITDHDTIAGALKLAHRPDVIVGCEVTAMFPDSPSAVHIGVLDISESQHREIDRLRHDVRQLLPYLRRQGIFSIVNHVASQVNGCLSLDQIASLIPWVDAFEVINGSRLASQNCTAASLAHAAGKVAMAGSDSHTGRGIGRTYTVVDGARCREEFMDGLRNGRARVGGRHGHWLTMASDMLRLAGRFYEEAAIELWQEPLNWKKHALAAGAAIGAPLVTIPLLGAVGHFIEEARFNRRLLFDLVSAPAPGGLTVAGLSEAA